MEIILYFLKCIINETTLIPYIDVFKLTFYCVLAKSNWKDENGYNLTFKKHWNNQETWNEFLNTETNDMLLGIIKGGHYSLNLKHFYISSSF